MRDFERAKNEFEKEWRSTKRNMWIGGIISTVISLGILGFIVWVIITLMRFYGVI